MWPTPVHLQQFSQISRCDFIEKIAHLVALIMSRVRVVIGTAPWRDRIGAVLCPVLARGLWANAIQAGCAVEINLTVGTY